MAGYFTFYGLYGMPGVAANHWVRRKSQYRQAVKHLVPAKRQLVTPQDSCGRWFTMEPGEAFQMDRGFAKAVDYDGGEYNVACFAMAYHHFDQQYVEFFPNAKREKEDHRISDLTQHTIQENGSSII